MRSNRGCPTCAPRSRPASAAADECSRQLRATCENALPHQSAPRWFEETVEFIFVALVVALGLRS
jgi:hypothetical protein